MAPKGIKRAAAPSKDEPELKRVAAFLKQRGVTKSTHEALRGIVSHPLAGLPVDCREMLLSMLPWSLCVPSDERNANHNEAVKMMEEVAASIQGRMREAVEAESASVGELDEKRASLQGAIDESEAALAEAAATVEARKVELAEASAVLLRQRRALGEAESKKQKDASEADAIQAQKQEVESVMSESFQKLKSGECQPEEEDALFQPVQALLVKLDLDESLVTSLPVSLKKRQRGAFDQVVVDKFEEVLNSKVGECVASISAMESTAIANATAVEDAKATLEEAQAKQQELASSFGAAQETSTKAATKVKQAQGVLAAFEPEYTKTTAARQAKVEELESFEAYHVCILKTAVEKVSKRKEREFAQEAAAAEQVAEASQTLIEAVTKEQAAAAQVAAEVAQASAAEAGA